MPVFFAARRTTVPRGHRRHSTPARIGVTAVLGLLAACSRERDPLAWIGERAAVVRCTAAGRNPPAPAIQGVPAPPVPTGLLARQLDPIALDDLGFERDTTVCAVLEAPASSTIDIASSGLPAILTLHDSVDREATRIGGRCTCEAARELGLRDLVASCMQTPTVPGCNTDALTGKLAVTLAPLETALGSIELPWTHWRLVGKTDRPGWFVEHVQTLVANHSGGSQVFVRGEPLPARVDDNVRALVELEHVVAVVRQDSGRALVVARERDGMLVLDHFAQPPSEVPRAPLTDRIFAAQVTTLAAALAPPVTSRAPLSSPDDGTLVEFDRAMLEELDRAAIATSPLLAERFVEPTDTRFVPPVLFDRVAFVAPYGHDGKVLRAIQLLSAEGLAWAQTVGNEPLLGHTDALRLAGRSPEALELPEGMRFALRGTEVEAAGLHGLHRLPEFADALERRAPGAMGGEVSAWRLSAPAGELPPPFDAGAAFAGLRMLARAQAYELSSSFDTGRTRLTIEARPR